MLDADARQRLGLKRIRIALLASFSIEFVCDALIAQGLVEGIDVDVYQAGFNQYRQEILDPASSLYAFAPDIAVVAIEGEHLLPMLYGAFLQETSETIAAAVERAGDELAGLVSAFSQQARGLLLMHLFDPPRYPSLGIVDGKSGLSQAEWIEELNTRLRNLARDVSSLHLVDYPALVAEVGRERWYDARMAHYAKAPISLLGLQRLAARYARFLRAHAGRSRKCLVLDLDNTLWGGVIGEDGLQGIRLGPDYPGSAFVDFQRAIAELERRGVLLAIASKNNPADAWEVFERHPHALLHKEDFVAAHINWGPKDESLRAIAAELNIALEHLVFIDDNPAECMQVRQALPMVTVLELPKAPEQYVHRLMADGLFDNLAYSDEDRRRAELYRQRTASEALMQEAVSLETYYRQLEMSVHVELLTDATTARAAQMTQKTNQFNITTRRYTESAMHAFTKTGGFVLTVRVADRFGDHGIVGLIMARPDGETLDIDTMLLSCRVIGRTIETGMLSVLCDEARARGLRCVIGRIVPTTKNMPVRGLFSGHGFERLSGGDETESSWRLDLTSGSVSCPPWLRLEAPAAHV